MLKLRLQDITSDVVNPKPTNNNKIYQLLYVMALNWFIYLVSVGFVKKLTSGLLFLVKKTDNIFWNYLFLLIKKYYILLK